MSSLAPVPAESSTCASCSAPLVADQRYCLSCGQPVSPVRLAFLDVLEREHRPGAGAAPVAAVAYPPYAEPPAGPAWLRRYTPLFAVAAVLLVAMLIGLLVGHWVSQSKSPANQVIKVEGLSAGTGATPSSTSASSTGGASSTSGTNPSSSKEEKQEEAEAKAEEKKPVALPKPKSVSSTTLSKLTNTTGKRHQEEINKLGTAPIAVP